MFISWKVVSNKKTSLLGTKISQNDKLPINSNLIVGSVLFGAGWGLVGLCPGPAIASLSFGGTNGYIFIISMLIGILLISLVSDKFYFKIK
jgi:hypothetical protein